ncbi:helix-turn-helix domain-containing protein [Novosphingobium olei]|uniref:Helix-turn-helix domain-containing protein n=1 Tax=Novosphingobium olei TaxID=2728851 RepID=A0A7Y0GA51_9SPHN|nr:helix-turn-helix domain-containing protein [Novosphingobium olei]NML93292.1 helix-turn-helix domain-containing protein [Novosphingobium olei]
MNQPAAIPTFALYGEGDWQSPAGFAHIETIAERSALHDWTIAPHRHDRVVQLLVVQEGHARVTLDGAPFALPAPSFIVVPTGVVHGFRFDPGTRGHVLTLSQEFAGRGRGDGDPLPGFLAQGGSGEIAADAVARVDWLTRELLHIAESAGATADPLFEALAEALVRSIAGQAATPGDDRRLGLFRHLVETHLAEQRPLEFYARSMGLTVRTLTRLTRARLGAPPQVLINRRLALEAQRRLRYTSATVAQIAEDLGFADPSWFSRFYLRMTGHRPLAERQALRGRLIQDNDPAA